jgi:competence ComEA-like helix-hairpin-helix protein
MQENWRDLFSFNHRERNGIVVLMILMVLLMAIHWSLPYYFPNNIHFEYTELENLASQLKTESSIYSGSSSSMNSISASDEPFKIETPNPEFFNPNDGLATDWVWTGLSTSQIRSILKYIEKGGRFKVKSDVSKMYVISPEMYQKIEPYLLLPDTIVRNAKEFKSNTEMEKPDVLEPLLVNINTADTTELKALKGIGSYYAKQIVEYRERLGGYYQIDQLYEIERLREETIQMIEPFIIFDTTIIRKVHINSDKASVLVRHPYITWNMAKNIEDHRAFKKRFKTVDELLTIGLLTDELYSKLAPYLEL